MNVDWKTILVQLIVAVIAGIVSGLLVLLLGLPYTMRQETERQTELDRLAYLNAVHALRIETSQNQALVNLIPDEPTEYIVAPFTMDAAKGVLNNTQIFEFAGPDLVLLLTIYLSAAEGLSQRIEAANQNDGGKHVLKASKGFYLDILYDLQKMLDRELQESPIYREQVQSVFDRVKEIREKWYPTSR
ncbi:hypothetical protein MYX84_15145 [Acidobacteria bacterium AH-259-O06]|nr:hypothetical protein [Acidobacteria bacterium AH-259-O06]